MLRRRCILVLCVAILCCAVGVTTKRQRRQHGGPHPYLSIDAFGNCQANDPTGQRHITGRCTRYANCPSARYNWDVLRVAPISCYYTTYENFVCCPDIHLYNTPHHPIQPPTAPQTPAVQPFYAPSGFAMRNMVQRISEQECDAVYFGRRHRRRSKRDSEANIVEEVIEKVNASKVDAVGGLRTYTDEYPYMCALGWKSSRSTSYNCGCVLIAKKFVLTAAHCASIGGESPNVVRLGGVDLDQRRAEQIRIKRIVQHPDYNQDLAYNDIAIIKLSKNSRQTPACLWAASSLAETQLTALGYGQTRFAGPSSNTLLQVFLTVVANSECSASYTADEKLPHGIAASQLCAVDRNGRMDTCQGDSGGPLLIRVNQRNRMVPHIVGLTSFGEGCATGTPSVYTRIASYIDWIEEVVWGTSS